MDFSYVSPRTHLRTEDGVTIEFNKYGYNGDKPPLDKCKKKITGVSLSYAFRGEQDITIQPLMDAFGVEDNKGVITKVPFEMVEVEGVRCIKYGDEAILDNNIIQKTKDAGIIGYWDDSNLMICAAPDYAFVIDSIREMFIPKHVRFGFHKGIFSVRNLLILPII